jgi:hypothetical protein
MSGDASGKPTPSYKEILRSKDKAVRFTELLIGGKKKNRSVVKKIQYHHIERKEYAICCISRKIIVP